MLGSNLFSKRGVKPRVYIPIVNVWQIQTRNCSSLQDVNVPSDDKIQDVVPFSGVIRPDPEIIERLMEVMGLKAVQSDSTNQFVDFNLPETVSINTWTQYAAYSQDIPKLRGEVFNFPKPLPSSTSGPSAADQEARLNLWKQGKRQQSETTRLQQKVWDTLQKMGQEQIWREEAGIVAKIGRLADKGWTLNKVAEQRMKDYMKLQSSIGEKLKQMEVLVKDIDALNTERRTICTKGFEQVIKDMDIQMEVQKEKMKKTEEKRREEAKERQRIQLIAEASKEREKAKKEREEERQKRLQEEQQKKEERQRKTAERAVEKAKEEEEERQKKVEREKMAAERAIQRVNEEEEARKRKKERERLAAERAAQKAKELEEAQKRKAEQKAKQEEMKRIKEEEKRKK